MLHIPLYRLQGHRSVWKSNNISSSPTAVRSATISSSCSPPSGPVRSVLKLLVTSSSDQYGRFPIATRTHSMAEASLGGEVSSDYVPFPLPCHQMESDNVGSELLQRHDRKPQWHAVKHCHSSAVSDWRVHRKNTVAGRFAGVDTICKLFIYEYSQVQVVLGHPRQR